MWTLLTQHKLIMDLGSHYKVHRSGQSSENSLEIHKVATACQTKILPNGICLCFSHLNLRFSPFFHLSDPVVLLGCSVVYSQIRLSPLLRRSDPAWRQPWPVVWCPPDLSGGQRPWRCSTFSRAVSLKGCTRYGLIVHRPICVH